MRATLFDFNGVLVDDEAVHFAAFRDVVAPLGIVLTQEMYTERYLGFDDVGAFRAILVDAGRPADRAETAEEVRQLIEAKKPIYMERIGRGLVVIPGAVELLDRRAARGPVGIVSGALRHEIVHALEIMRVADRVAFIVGADDTKACKPDPEGYLRGLVALGIDLAAGPEVRKGVVVVEDSLAGVAAARHAGLRVLALTSSYPADRLRAAGAAVVAVRLDELVDGVFDEPEAG